MDKTGDGKFVGSAGLQEVTSLVSPQVLLQLSSLALGMYHMHVISNKLDKILQSVQDIHKLMERKTDAKLLVYIETALEYFQELFTLCDTKDTKEPDVTTDLLGRIGDLRLKSKVELKNALLQINEYTRAKDKVINLLY